MPHPAAAHQAALLRLSRLQLDEKVSLDRAFERATALIARTLGVERVGIWMFDDDRRRMECVCLYERSRNAWSAGELLRPVDFPTYTRALESHRAIVADDARTHPLTRELAGHYLIPHGITSMLDAPLLRMGEVVGVVCHEHVGPRRHWTEEEASFAASVADLVALAIEHTAHIEARRTLEEQTQRLAEVERMASLGRVAAAVGHDFNNLLMIVLRQAEDLLRVPGLPPAAAAHARTIADAVTRGGELVAQLVELGRGSSETPAPLVLDDVVAAAESMLRSAATDAQRLTLLLDASGARVRIDRSRLERVLLNLVVNAFDATRAGGTVTVSTAVVEDVDGRHAVLSVADDGPGIDAAIRPHIFEPYFTTRRGAGGSGLGLAIVHAVVQRAGGFIAVDSAPGRGATFAVHLPIADDA